MSLTDTVLAQNEVTTPEVSASESVLVVFAANVFDLKVDVNSTFDIQGPTHFFSSRHNKYAGGRFMAHHGGRPGDHLYSGFFTGFLWGKSSFRLNWEVPGLMSFSPLESSIGTFAWVVGYDVNLQLANFLILSPYVSARMMLLNMHIKIDDEDYVGNSYKTGLDAGVKASINLGKFTLAAGAGLTHIIGEEIDIEVDDLTFATHTSGSSPEYFLGVEFK
jgi:hypothetical protein